MVIEPWWNGREVSDGKLMELTSKKSYGVNYI